MLTPTWWGCCSGVESGPQETCSEWGPSIECASPQPIIFEEDVILLFTIWAAPPPVAQTPKNLPALQETWDWSLGQEDPLEKEMATHSSILAWRIPWTEEPGGIQFMGSQRVGHNWVTNPSTFHLTLPYCSHSDSHLESQWRAHTLPRGLWPCLVKRGTGTPLWLTMMGGYRNSWPWRSHFQQGPPAPMKHIPVLCPIPCAPQSREIEFRRSPQMRGSDLVCTTSEHRVTIWVAGAQSSIKVWECGMWNELLLLLTRSLSNWDSLAQSRHSVHLLMIIAQVPHTFLYPRNTKMFGQWKQ